MQNIDKKDPNIDTKQSSKLENTSENKNQVTYTIKDLMADDAKILLFLNAFIQKRHQNPKWDVKTENG